MSSSSPSDHTPPRLRSSSPSFLLVLSFSSILFLLSSLPCSISAAGPPPSSKRKVNINFDGLFPVGDASATNSTIAAFPVRIVNTSSIPDADVEIHLNYNNILKGLPSDSIAKYGAFADTTPPTCVNIHYSTGDMDPSSYSAAIADPKSPFTTTQGSCRTNYAYSGAQALQCGRPGDMIEVKWTVKNTGSLTWLVEDVTLQPKLPVPTGWRATTLYLDKPTAPGQNGVFYGLLHAPVLVGLWNLGWQIHSSCVGAFGDFVAPVELTCSDFVFCNGMERLVNGQCVSAVRPACDDGYSCTIDACDEVKARCQWTVSKSDPACQFVKDCYTIAANTTCIRTCNSIRVCGDDGCGGVCGNCPAGFGCANDGQCTYLQISTPGTCVKPTLLQANSSVPLLGVHTRNVDLGKGFLQNKFTCSPDTSGPQVVFTFTVPNDNISYGVDIRFSNGIGAASTLDVLLELRKGYCVDPEKIIGIPPVPQILSGPTQNTWCNDDYTPPGRVGSHLALALTPGVYYLYAGGFNVQQAYSATLTAKFVAGYVPYCQARYCGPDGGGGDCGPCPSGLMCDAQLRCSVPPSSDDCTIYRCMNGTAVCGSDGCGGTCGPLNGGCPAGELCIVATGQCATFPVCDHYAPSCVNPCKATEFCATDCTCRPLATPLPDLFLWGDRLKSSILLETRRFDNYSCALVEACIDGLGMRTLLKFDTSIVNQGRGKLALPNPRFRPDEFIYGICHNHYHYIGFAEYQLLGNDPVSGQYVVKRGHKQGYCMLAETRFPTINGPDVPCRGTTTCEAPGLDRGWMDTYGSSVDCQWIDVTGVPSGNYTLRVEINAQRRILEETYDNNVEILPIILP